MKIKVTLGTMQNASKLVSIAESISCDVDLCYGRYIVDAKSMLGVLSLPDFAYGELQIPVETEYHFVPEHGRKTGDFQMEICRRVPAFRGNVRLCP